MKVVVIANELSPDYQHQVIWLLVTNISYACLQLVWTIHICCF